MNYNPYGFEDIFKACGYIPRYDNSSSDKSFYDGNFQSNSNIKNNGNGHAEDGTDMGESGGTNGSSFSGFDFRCNDIPLGFQKMYPQMFVIIGEIIGNAVAGRIPVNVQDAFGNWLQLVGQVILTYNAQQQYFQSGPGRYFSPINYNVSNPFCTYGSFSENREDKKTHKKSKVSRKDIRKIDNNINDLVKEINSLKYQLDRINEKIEQENNQ